MPQTRGEAERLLSTTLDAWRKQRPKLAPSAEEAIPDILTVFDLLTSHRARLRTTNGLERIHRELRRRTRVASIFPNPESCLRLVSSARRAGRRVDDQQGLSHSTRLCACGCMHSRRQFTPAS
jgi:transposase-like protein